MAHGIMTALLFVSTLSFLHIYSIFGAQIPCITYTYPEDGSYGYGTQNATCADAGYPDYTLVGCLGGSAWRSSRGSQIVGDTCYAIPTSSTSRQLLTMNCCDLSSPFGENLYPICTERYGELSSTKSNVTCQSHETLLGCMGLTQSGNTQGTCIGEGCASNMLTSNVPDVGVFYPSDDTCVAVNGGSAGGITAEAICCYLGNTQVNLECNTLWGNLSTNADDARSDIGCKLQEEIGDSDYFLSNCASIKPDSNSQYWDGGYYYSKSKVYGGSYINDSTTAICDAHNGAGSYGIYSQSLCCSYTTSAPTNAPTNIPSSTPSDSPVQPPTSAPSNHPSNAPSGSPSQPPTNAPSDKPSFAPSNAPSSKPTSMPSYSPSDEPTLFPSDEPTNRPTNEPSEPSMAPTGAPSETSAAASTSNSDDWLNSSMGFAIILSVIIGVVCLCAVMLILCFFYYHGKRKDEHKRHMMSAQLKDLNSNSVASNGIGLNNGNSNNNGEGNSGYHTNKTGSLSQVDSTSSMFATNGLPTNFNTNGTYRSNNNQRNNNNNNNYESIEMDLISNLTDKDGDNASSVGGISNRGVSHGNNSNNSNNDSELGDILNAYPQPVIDAAVMDGVDTAGGMQQGEGGENVRRGGPGAGEDRNSDDDVLLHDNNNNNNRMGMGMGMARDGMGMARDGMGNGGNGNGNGMSTDAVNRAKWMGWQNWKSDKVCQWLEYELMNNYGLDSKDEQIQVKNFIVEFKKHNVNGKLLEKIKNDPNWNHLKYLQSGFSDQSMGLWLGVKDAVSELP